MEAEIYILLKGNRKDMENQKMDIPSKDKHRRQDISHWNGSGGAENQGKGHLVGNTWES